MTSVILLVTAAVVPVEALRPVMPVDVETVLAAWRSREKSIISADIRWRVTRDSRSSSFGLSAQGEQERAVVWQLRTSGNRLRLDGEMRMTSVGGSFSPELDDAALSKVTFKKALFSGFDGPQHPIFHRLWHGLANSTDRGLDIPAGLDRITAIAPLLALRPLSSPEYAVNPQSLRITTNSCSIKGRDCLVLEEQLEKGVRHFVCERGHPFRILRVMGPIDGRQSGQIDLSYGAKEPLFPASWTAQLLDANGVSVAFASAECVSSELGSLHIDARLFQRAERTVNSHISEAATARRTLRWLLGIPGLIGLGLLLIAAMALRTYRNVCTSNAALPVKPSKHRGG